MGAMRKMGLYLGLVEDLDGEYADERAYDAYEEGEPTPEPAPRAVSHLHDRRPSQMSATASMPMSRIVTLHPRTYNEARVIGENYRDGIPVIMNLTEMNDMDAKRLVDFAAGLVFSVRGSIDRVTQRVFLLTPPNVSVDVDEREHIVEGGFFNQS